MGWRGRGRDGGLNSTWPGRGPFSYLPPWQRPGRLYGRGACWWLLNPDLKSTASQVAPTFTKEQEQQVLEQQVKVLRSQLDAVKKRLEELSK